MNKCQEWYNNIAKRNHGYKSDAHFVKEGLSGEDEFEKRLIELLPDYANVLDVGCGHGEFTLKMSDYTKKLTGGDSAIELISIANKLKHEQGKVNTEFIYLHTHEMDKIESNKYDMIYNRRGPTSIYDHKRILKPGGVILGIHPYSALEKVKQRLMDGGFEDIKIEEFTECALVFENETDFAEHLSSMHMSKDYTLDENKEMLDKLIADHTFNGRLILPEERFIITAR
ncbi:MULTISPECIES: class I SAM-dependent methyltransferase [unclassified Fusibacter]|uniref:class I SAM-dependent methyltransferase n=1 Tax=unclassified Fusibacter TaxID=2624464 RepID=UPI0010134B0D|nr:MULTISPECIES: class I SAM-dependent methyltransferase [unclassified Fusibacter]MCK8061155.1 class I SAM-dependent methyltransferase [Fusibacter sp. A2]NPE23308.1 class I SAM-dependent methyltransferase [Fusibacter sp. A1]RXV59349.1 class I SAM-dependent methyltransferase [Fusibacter sp. A1]